MNEALIIDELLGKMTFSQLQIDDKLRIVRKGRSPPLFFLVLNVSRKRRIGYTLDTLMITYTRNIFG